MAKTLRVVKFGVFLLVIGLAVALLLELFLAFSSWLLSLLHVVVPGVLSAMGLGRAGCCSSNVAPKGSGVLFCPLVVGVRLTFSPVCVRGVVRLVSVFDFRS